ncbi:hypothetical protein Tco_0362460, partial [Tanacetum coccineum]
LFVKKFKKEFTTGLNIEENQTGTSGARHDNDDVDYVGHCNDEDDVGHANDGDVHANGKDEVDFAEKLAKEAAEKTSKEAKKEAAEKAKREKIDDEKKNK